jgi:hypothetical protein
MVYFWTITQEYRADWSLLDELVEAKLEIRYPNGDSEVLPLTDYVLQDPTGTQTPETYRIYTGEEAYRRFDKYSQELDAYWDELEEYIANENEGIVGERPIPPKLFSTKILQGFIVDLDPGIYQTRLLSEGNEVISDSEKQLIVFAPRRRGAGYKMIPETKWTVPEWSSTPEEIIYISGKTRLFYQPYIQAEVNAYLYEKLLNPQSASGDEASWTWIPLEEIDDVKLVYSSSGAQHDVSKQAFSVNQIAGGTRGYMIDPYDPARGESAPTFLGFEVNIDLEPKEVATLWLVDERSEKVPESTRILRGIQPSVSWRMFLPALSPLLLTVALWTRHQIRSRKNR